MVFIFSKTFARLEQFSFYGKADTIIAAILKPNQNLYLKILWNTPEHVAS
jgi:hypothetical protein